jgi:hypothetical protein
LTDRRGSLPELGETNGALAELHSRVTLFPGVRFQAPEFPARYLAAHGISSSMDVYHRNQALIANLYHAAPFVGAGIWASTQPEHSVWDYKYAGDSELHLTPLLWRTNDAIGYFNGAYTGEQVYGRDLLLRGYGAVKTRSQKRAGKPVFGPLTLGNKPEGYIWAQMGLDYYEDELDQPARDFLDESTDPGLQILHEIDRLKRRSFAAEFQQRWEDLKARAKQHDTRTYNYMLEVEQEAKEAEAERQREQAFQEMLRREQEHNREIEEKIRSWAPQSNSSQNQPSPAPSWQPPAWKPPPLPTAAPTFPPLPQPQMPVWTPIPYHRSGGGGGGGGCDEDCGNSGGQPVVPVGPPS